MIQRIFAVGAICCMLAIAAVAQSKGANFAGTWELDKSKSQMQGPMADAIKSLTWTVTQTDAQISRDSKVERNEGAGPGGPPGGGPPGGGRGGGMMGMMGGPPMTIKLDGSETTQENPRGKATMKAKWAGEKLEINTVRNMNTPNGEMSITTVETWELLDGGKTLKVHQTTETPMGTREATMVFAKK
jgi:hypothetical protein